MRRALFLLLVLIGLAPLAMARPAASAHDWTATVSRAPNGSIVIGNPAARVKLVEYLSYICPHCAAFSAESQPVLKEQFVRSGSTSLEVRPLAGQPIDLAAAMLVRCAGGRASHLSDAIFAHQGEWYARGADFAATNAARLNIYPVPARLRAIADGAGLTDLARAQGVAPAAVDACFATDADMRRMVAVAAQANVEYTPTFAIGGKLIGSATWAQVEPQLRAAGAR